MTIQKRFSLPLVFAFLSFSFATAPSLRADNLYVWAIEVGGDVVFLHRGFIDLTGFPAKSTETIFDASIHPSAGSWMRGGTDANVYSSVRPAGAARTFGSGGETLSPIPSGDLFTMSAAGDFGVPDGFVSGSPLSGSMTFDSTTLAALGVDTTPFTFQTVGGRNTIHMFTSAQTVVDNLRKEIKKLKGELRALN